MSATTGVKIPAADFNSIQSTISTVLGTPSGNYGYGQAPASAQVATGNQIKLTDWQNVITDITHAYSHIYGSAPSVPALSNTTRVKAADVNALATLATQCSTNRLTIAAANQTAIAPTSNTTITRATTWGNGSTGITCVASFTWASEAAASAFFNTGGTVTMKLAHPTTSTTQDNAWNGFLSAIGTMVFSGTGSTKAGGNGTMTSLAYSAYTTGGTAVMNAVTMTTAAYTANYITVTVKKITNGMSITVLLEDNHTNAYYDSVASGTNAAFGWSYATDSANLATAITVPTFAKTTNF
ncbi:hypothetical protein ACAX43_12570 [Paraburkholderia sp. IW21]|uniref:hypothetical protein n=1 Tax=Paraburkholderia sp. IW21 TaxID=3242488 RepID=UPI003521333F